MPSPAELIADRLAREDLTPQERREVLKTVAGRARDWRFWARPDQLEPPGDWQIWPVIAGRGAGKTRTGAEYCIDRAIQYHRANVEMRGGLVGRTAADVRDTMVEGESGIMACLDRRKIAAKYEPGRRRIVIRPLQATLHTYSAMEPDSLRGPQHHTLWCDEPGAWRHRTDAQGNNAWTNALFGLRLDAAGLIPRVVATTTPKPIPLIKEWFEACAPCKRPAGHTGKHGGREAQDDREAPLCGIIDGRVVMTRGSLYDNIAHLAPMFVSQIVDRYRDSPLGAQEIFGRLVLSNPGALWQMAKIEASRRLTTPELSRVIIAVDPPAEAIAECGIIVLGIGAWDREVYVLDDLSLVARGEDWGAKIVEAYRNTEGLYPIDPSLVVAERNMGGDMVRTVIHLQDSGILYEPVNASQSKWERAEPVASAYSQVHHVDYFPDLEAQMCTWTKDEDFSPDRLDALVHGVRYLMPHIIGAPVQSFSAADLQLQSTVMQRGDRL